jgi:4-amino-4-deoxy-L-arabinose transferase-like glycosyltransferase
MTKTLPFLLAATFLLATLLVFPDGAIAAVFCLVFTIILGFGLQTLAEEKTEKDFLWNLFLAALILRVLYGTLAYYFDFWLYFAGDAETYNFSGNVLAEYLKGNVILNDFESQRFFGFRQSGWGMFWLVGFVYYFIGQNPLAGNMFCAIFGALAAPISYLCAKELFSNSRIGKITGFFVAFFPGFINWSSFMMKDGILVFLLVLAVLMIIRLQKAFSLLYVSLLLFSLLGIVSLRFYIFPMILTAILGSFLIGVKNQAESSGSLLRRCVLIVGIGVVLTYAGAFSAVQESVETYGSIERLNNARLDQSQTADSGFERVDVSTTEGAISFLPIGLMYLMLAPFPWQLTSIRSALTMPEMLIWWASIPFLISGIIFAVKNRLRETMPVLIFTLMLTVGYAIFQGNVGTAYRQRTQIQVFHFMFIGAGLVLFMEKRENERLLKNLKQQRNRIGLQKN